MKVKLVAFNFDLYAAWKKCFDAISEVEIIDGDILDQEGDAIVSPANSFGYMDGGLDLKYGQHFGWGLESKVREKLEKEHFGELPVGNAIIIETGVAKTPYLITAPTMRVPCDVSNTVNAYLAFKAVLQAAIAFNNLNSSRISTILCPGLGTGEGRMPAPVCARQMLIAYQTVIEGKVLKQGGLAGAVENHIELMGRG